MNYIFRAVNEIINDGSITSISALTAKATSSSWNSTILQYLDTTNSVILRTGTGVTGLTSNTASHYAKSTTSTTGSDDHDWTVQFSVYDNTATKYYVQHKNTTINSLSTTCTMGTTITGTFASNEDVTVAPNSGTSIGSLLNVGGTASVIQPTPSSDSGNFTVVRAFFLYITDTCMVWGASCSAATIATGFQGNYSNSTYWIGPFIYSQYDRFDYHNTDTNGVIPLLFTNIYSNTYGFGWSSQVWGIENSMFGSVPKQSQFRVLNLINAFPNTSTTYPMVVAPSVNWGIGSRFNDYSALTTQTSGATATFTAATLGQSLFLNPYVRYPSVDLKEATFAMLPISWRHLYYYNTGGGDASSRGGWYLFNGDYFPGDEFTYNNKTYIILPTWSGYSNRLGIAIPKE